MKNSSVKELVRMLEHKIRVISNDIQHKEAGLKRMKKGNKLISRYETTVLTYGAERDVLNGILEELREM